MQLAISPCPNDTFAFYALVHGKTSWAQPFDVVFEDIEDLNLRCFDGNVDICKVSFHAYLYVKDRYRLLQTGAALGRGCGPLLVAKKPFPLSELSTKTIAVPGRWTTALLLLKLMAGADLNLKVMVFDQIMPAVARGDVDAGLIIHESRFTYARYGLSSLVDLGEWWESQSGCPIPLGGIVAKKSLGEERIDRLSMALGESIDYAWAHQSELVPFMQAHAQEMETPVMMDHVGLYVNAFTRGLGPQGTQAVITLERRARSAGLLSAERPPVNGELSNEMG